MAKNVGYIMNLTGTKLINNDINIDFTDFCKRKPCALASGSSHWGST